MFSLRKSSNKHLTSHLKKQATCMYFSYENYFALGPFGGASAPAPARATSASELELHQTGGAVKRLLLPW